MMKHNLLTDVTNHNVFVTQSGDDQGDILGNVFDSKDYESVTFCCVGQLANVEAPGLTINKIYQSDSDVMTDKIEVPSNKIIGVLPLLLDNSPYPPEIYGFYPTFGVIDTKQYLQVEVNFPGATGTNEISFYIIAVGNLYKKPEDS